MLEEMGEPYRLIEKIGSGGMGDHILLVGFEQVFRFSAFLPPFHRTPEAKRFRPGLDDVRPVRDAVKQCLA